jgi:hypothetical protein
LQADVNKRTEEFDKQHPDLTKLTDKEKADLQTLRRDQQEVAELVEEFAQPGGNKPEADKKPEPGDKKPEGEKP